MPPISNKAAFVDKKKPRVDGYDPITKTVYELLKHWGFLARFP